MLELRAATEDDWVALPDLQVAAGAAFRDVGMPEVADNPPLSVAALRAAAAVFVAAYGGPPVGFAVAEVVDGTAHLEQVSVHPDHAGRGIGRRLIDRLGDWGRQRGLAAVTLITFRAVPWNAPYYARLGFVEVPPAELGPELAAVLRTEAEQYGLDLAQRVVMRRDA